MALAALGLTEVPVHDHHSERLISTTERYHAPREIRLIWAALRAAASAFQGAPDWILCVDAGSQSHDLMLATANDRVRLAGWRI